MIFLIFGPKFAVKANFEDMQDWYLPVLEDRKIWYLLALEDRKRVLPISPWSMHCRTAVLDTKIIFETVLVN